MYKNIAWNDNLWRLVLLVWDKIIFSYYCLSVKRLNETTDGYIFVDDSFVWGLDIAHRPIIFRPIRRLNDEGYQRMEEAKELIVHKVYIAHRLSYAS